MRPLLAIVALCVVLAGLAGCSGVKRINDRDLKPIDLPQLESMLDGRGDFSLGSVIGTRKSFVLIDVRSANAFAEGHIPGAISIPMPQLEAADPRLSGGTLIVYGQSFASKLSAVAAKKVMRFGLGSPVYDFRGGYDHWVDQGRATATAQP